jgi:NADPH:quinone reductase-like Zn-dependent oxidoreductase
MKAMRLRNPASLENIYLGTAEAAAPAVGEIKVRIRANSINFRDYIVATGYLPSGDGRILLSDGAGEVVEVGAGVTEFKAGDAVVSTFHTAWLDGHIERTQLTKTPGGTVDGYACEFTTQPATAFTHAPEGLTHAESATLTCAGVTAWRAVMTKAAGATVIATSSSAEKLERLKALGADHVINYNETREWGAAVQALTDSVGVDHVIEVGGPNTMAQSFVAARTNAHIAIIGAVAGFKIDTIPFAILQAKRLRLQGVTVGSRRDQTDMVRAIEVNGIKPVVDRSFPLEQLADAFRHMNAGQHVGKVCIDV